MEIDIRSRNIGLNFKNDGEAEIYLWAPFALSVTIIAGNNSIKLNLIKKDFGYWFLKTAEIKEGDDYCFKICQSGETEYRANEKVDLKRADPASLYQKNGIAQFSTAFNINRFHWDDHNWWGIPLEAYIIYELHTGTFTPEGDFLSIEERLSYLKDLGITAIEIMPVAQFSGERNWGYDGVYPFAVQNSYGGPAALQHLINACHQKGLAVILDVVYNHMGPEGNYFNDFGPYFTDKYHTPWGAAINFDDANCDPVRQYFIENVLMWFRDFHVDALRLDAVHAIKDFSAKHILEEIKEYVNQLSEVTGRDYHLMVELDLNDNKYINPLEKNGYGMNAQWIDEFHHALRVTAGQEQSGYYSDFNGIEHLAKSYQDAYVYDGQYSPHREKKFGKKATGNPGEQFIVFAQNHDQVGNRMLGERTSELLSYEMTKLLAGAVFCSPYLPLVFMGEEYGETNRFQFFTSHSNEDLIAAVREGRKAEFAAFHHGDETPDPQSADTFFNSKLNWQCLDEDRHLTLFKYYKAIIQLRKSYPALAVPDRNGICATALPVRNCLMLKRWQGKQQIICLMNFSSEQQTIEIENLTDYRIIFNSASKIWGGSADEEISASNRKTTILPESIQIFLSENA